MKVGTQHGDSDEILRALAGFGVNTICSRLPSERLDEHWSVEGLSRLRERIESFGITLDVVPLPMSSNYITRAELPNIMLGKSPERDREIEIHHNWYGPGPPLRQQRCSGGRLELRNRDPDVSRRDRQTGARDGCVSDKFPSGFVHDVSPRVRKYT